MGGGGGDMRDGRRWRRHEGWEEVEETWGKADKGKPKSID